MSRKQNDTVTLVSSVYGTVTLVKRSVGRYRKILPDGRLIVYWRGQLSHDWEVRVSEYDHVQFGKGDLVWLDASFFTELIEY